MGISNTRFLRAFVAILFAALASLSGAQEIGTDVCYCAPSRYEFTLDLSLLCPSAIAGDGVGNTFCIVGPP